MLAVVTVLAIIGKPYLPPKTLLLHPADATDVAIFNAGAVQANNVTWVDQSAYASRCLYETVDGGMNCGISLSWGLENPECLTEVGRAICKDSTSDLDGDGWGWENSRICRIVGKERGNLADNSALNASRCRFSTAPETLNSGEGGKDSGDNISSVTFQPADGIDFSRYDGLNITAQYSGRAEYLRLFLINRNPEKLPENQAGPGKFMSAFVRTEDLKAGSAFVELDQFSVAEWWILTSDAPRALAAPEFNRIFAMGIDHVETGVHNLAVERVELVGERISWDRFLSLLVAFWTVVLLLEGVIRYYTLSELSRSRQQRIAELSNLFNSGELVTGSGRDGKADLDENDRDELTGLCNRTGVARHLTMLEEEGQVPSNLGILLIDIDQFRRINDIYGRDTGDQTLREVARVLSSKVRDGDLLARWSGEEFILIVRNVNRDGLMKMAEKLRALMAETVFAADKAVHLTVSIGVTSSGPGDSFELTLKRVDVAMYRAKSIRNSIAYE